jgi:hypothetical protein
MKWPNHAILYIYNERQKKRVPNESSHCRMIS